MTTTTELTVLDVLVEARRLIARPHGWARGSMRKLEPETDDGWAYCAIGALRHASRAGAVRVSDPELLIPSDRLLRDCILQTYGARLSVQYVNDVRATQGQMVVLFDCAIDKARENADV